MEHNPNTPKPFINPFDISDLKFPMYGLTENDLGKNNVESLLKGRKTDALTVRIKDKDTELINEFTARLSLKTKEGKVYPWLDFKSNQPLDLKDSIAGVRLSEEDKKDLLSGKAIWKTGLKSGASETPYDSWIIIDVSLNKLAFLKDSKIQAPTILKNVSLTEAQREHWRNGETIFLEGMAKANSTETFSAGVTHNPINGRVSWDFSNSRGDMRVEKQQDVTTVANVALLPSDKIPVKSQTETVIHIDTAKETKFKKGKHLPDPVDKEDVKTTKRKSNRINI